MVEMILSHLENNDRQHMPVGNYPGVHLREYKVQIIDLNDLNNLKGLNDLIGLNDFDGWGEDQ